MDVDELPVEGFLQTDKTAAVTGVEVDRAGDEWLSVFPGELVSFGGSDCVAYVVRVDSNRDLHIDFLFAFVGWWWLVRGERGSAEGADAVPRCLVTSPRLSLPLHACLGLLISALLQMLIRGQGDYQ